MFEWFAGLERDNSKAYFTATRDFYERDVRGGLEAMLDELSESFGGRPRVFRQQRDLRFSPDKSPYKTRTYGVLEGTPGARTGLYAAISASGLYAGTGYYRMARDQLERFRAAVADDGTGPGARRGDRRRPSATASRSPATRCAPPRAAIRATTPGSSCCAASRSSPAPRWPGEGGIARDAALDHAAGVLAGGRAAQRLARRARRGEHPAAGRAARAALSAPRNGGGA